MKIKDAAPWTTVSILGVVVKQDRNQTLLWVPGIGESGQWSVVSSAECDIVDAPSKVQMLAIESEIKRLRGMPHAAEG